MGTINTHLCITDVLVEWGWVGASSVWPGTCALALTSLHELHCEGPYSFHGIPQP